MVRQGSDSVVTHEGKGKHDLPDDVQDQTVPQQRGDAGAVIADTDDVAGGYRNILNYTEWVEYDAKVMLTVEEAMPLIMEALG